METKRFILKKLLVLAIGQLIFVTGMCGIFVLLKRFDWTVLLGGVIGAGVALGNFFLMAVAADHAADQAADQNAKGGKTTIRVSYLIRLAGLFALLFVFAWSGLCHPFALVLPVAVQSPILMITEFFRKSGDKQA